MDTATAAQRLNPGSLTAIFQNTPGRIEKPVVQCVQIKPMQNTTGGDGPERFRVVFSDSQNYVQTMLATTINEEIHSGRLKRGSIVQLLGYTANSVKGKRILIVAAINVLTELGEHEKIGQPTPMEIKEESNPDTVTSNGFYGNQQTKQEPSSRAIPSHAKAHSSQHANIYPIEALSPYSHKWTIKARCTSKGDIKRWQNQKGEGKLFSANFLDDSGEIRATGFNDQCDSLYDLLQEGSVYYITSPCRVQMAKKQFSNVNNDYELTFEKDTLVEKAETTDDVPQVRFNFTTIADLQSVEKDTTVDVIGILKERGEVNQITSKTTGNPYDKRELTLVDSTGYSVRLTIWGKTASSFDVPAESVVAFKGVKVSDFGGRSLSLLSSGTMTIDPDMTESHTLRGWYDAQGSNQNFNTHQGMSSTTVNADGTVNTSNRNELKTISQIHDEGLGKNQNGRDVDYFTLKASIQYIKQENFCYPACANADCNKKVLRDDSTGQWRCEKCNMNHERPEYRYIMSVNVMDHTGQEWLSVFNDQAKSIMGGKTADELMMLRENGDDTKVSEVFLEANYRTYIFGGIAKMDSYQDQEKVRYQVRSVTHIDYVSESEKLVKTIKLYDGMEDNSDSMFVN